MKDLWHSGITVGTQLQFASEHCRCLYRVLWIDQVYEATLFIHLAMALLSGVYTSLRNPIGVILVLLALVVMPFAVFVLSLDVDGQ